MSPKLNEILPGGNADQLRRMFDGEIAAEDFSMPLAAGWYKALLTKAELAMSSKQTPSVKLEFTIAEGHYAGRKFFHDCRLTASAMHRTQRKLGMLGIISLDQVEQPLPPGFRCHLEVAVHSNDNGTQHNVLKFFEIIGVDAPEPDPFASPPVDEAASVNAFAAPPITRATPVVNDDLTVSVEASLPPILAKATVDKRQYLLELKTGQQIIFGTIDVVNEDWITLQPVHSVAGEFSFDEPMPKGDVHVIQEGRPGIDVRLDAIAWVADDYL